jgi:hypothetical protein
VFSFHFGKIFSKTSICCVEVTFVLFHYFLLLFAYCNVSSLFSSSSFLRLILIYKYAIIRESPPNTPQRDRNAERQRERQQHVLDSPQACRLPARRRQSSPSPFRLPGLNGNSMLIKCLVFGLIFSLTRSEK